ncbi:hypothetical protein O181_019520 [Austropuccinia psidii MF-1]|uniref:Uncharacterized protein n=1 Tax=Austropuccinia psidii MF-1 TaxID=1389203 RepID=A0A9Q3CBY8_9BASI|nr:hypothetical protein [Austropuccinia psidii MF-1]
MAQPSKGASQSRQSCAQSHMLAFEKPTSNITYTLCQNAMHSRDVRLMNFRARPLWLPFLFFRYMLLLRVGPVTDAREIRRG